MTSLRFAMLASAVVAGALATTREMMACRNLADVVAIQSRWMEETLRDYNAEMGKLMTICTRSVNGGAGSNG